jgi:Mrp family chromosome partitioning ATPase
MPAVLHASVLPGVDVVTLPRPAGGRRGIVPSQVQKLIDEARSHYDMIVLDTPPVLPFADTPMLSLKADGAIMVVRWRRTPAAVVHSAVKVLSAYGVRILGGVVTQVQPKDVNGADDGQGHMYRHYASYFR